MNFDLEFTFNTLKMTWKSLEFWYEKILGTLYILKFGKTILCLIFYSTTKFNPIGAILSS